jgi:hypothetical protein
MASRCSRLTMAPVGLLGEAMKMSLVFGVMASRKRVYGNSSEASACTRRRCVVIMLALTSYMKKVGVEMSASSSSSSNAAQTRWIASSTPLVSRT